MSDDQIPSVDLQANAIAALAREMAFGLRPVPDILSSFQISQEIFEREIQQLAFYKQCYDAFVLEWESAASTNKRIALQAGAALEQILPRISARMADRREPLPAVTETAKLLARLSGAGEDKRSEQTGEKFKIIINLGADTQVFEDKRPEKIVDVTPVPALKAPE